MASRLRVSSPRAATPWQALRLFAALLPLLSTACVLDAARLRADCDAGLTSSCGEWGHQLLAEGEKQQAENAFARSCEGGNSDDCVYQGQLMMERGELDGAEPPLLKGYEAESAEATWALAELHQSRGNLQDLERAEHFRWDAPAIDKPDREFMFWVRPSLTNDVSYAVAYHFQPMEFWSRRMALGVHSSFNGRGIDELNAAVSYQYFLTPELVPYGTVLVGGTFQKRTVNAGAELGMKFCLGPYGHLNAAVGSSVGSPLHASIGIGINSLPVDLLLYIAAHL
ncbi:hypothetical protein [Hyalangium rubrum]|uniref:Lipoprotein n=1 Tax=Hyalangium rubrum TaxID=3103134 RepID=A0ABU5GYR6_9BACT|nr:hypothetical protein [Hyalangium sp. s54d21]MDY7225658.1 hypothetical protein [Hyalangium sp. s54d21]